MNLTANRRQRAAIKIILIFALCVPTVPPAFAAPDERAGTSAATALRQARSARVAGMGDVSAATEDGVWAMWGNPANVATITNREIALSRIQSFADISYNLVGYAQQIGRNTSAGIAYTGIDFGNIAGTDLTGRATGDINTGDHIASFTLAHTLRGQYALGATGRYINQRLGRHSAQTMTLDLGAGWRSENGRLRLGIAGQNLVGDLKFVQESFSLPRTVRAGVGVQFWDDRVLFGADVAKSTDSDYEFNLGAEVRVVKMFTLRGGAVFNRTDDVGFSGGLGLNHDRFNLDYAFTAPNGGLDGQHYVSLKVEF